MWVRSANRYTDLFFDLHNEPCFGEINNLAICCSRSLTFNYVEMFYNPMQPHNIAGDLSSV